jgi:hypothetical protein
MSSSAYRPVTLGPEEESKEAQNDITEEEIISIEDTYRETAGIGDHNNGRHL